jgi:hypothetical protein
MKIKTLRASGTRLQADVLLGYDATDFGREVSISVNVGRNNNPELAAAIAPLEAYLLNVAERRVKNVIEQKEG